MYNVALAREQAGISLANYHLSILWTGYLYVASRKKDFVQGHWREMELVIDIHLSAMFFGSIPPTPTKMYNAFMMRLGLSPAEHTKHRKLLVRGIGSDRSGELPLKKAAGSCLAISDTASLFGDWSDGKARFINTIHAVNGCIIYGSVENKERKRNGLDPLFFLESFCKHVRQDCVRFSIDYILLVQDCSTLLKTLLDTDTIGMSDEAYDPDHYKLARADGSRSKTPATITSNPVFVHLVRNILWEDKEWEQAQPTFKAMEKKGHGVLRISWIERAGKFCQQYLSERSFLTATGYMKQDLKPFDLTSSEHDFHPPGHSRLKADTTTEPILDEDMIKQARDTGFTVVTELPKPNVAAQGAASRRTKRSFELPRKWVLMLSGGQTANSCSFHRFLG
jgi:hypothetical protein